MSDSKVSPATAAASAAAAAAGVEQKSPAPLDGTDNPCQELEALYKAATAVSQGGGYLNIDGEDYYLVRNNVPLNLNGGRLRNDEPVDMMTPEQDELLFKNKYLKYRAKYLALKRK
jgi:hypothetical protein